MKTVHGIMSAKYGRKKIFKKVEKRCKLVLKDRQ